MRCPNLEQFGRALRGELIIRCIHAPEFLYYIASILRPNVGILYNAHSQYINHAVV